MFSACCCDAASHEELQVTAESTSATNELGPGLAAAVSSRRSSETMICETGQQLRVPRSFSVRSNESGDTSERRHQTLTEEQKQSEMMKLQELIRSFVQNSMKGLFVDVVLEDGSLVPCRFSLDGQLSVVTLHVQTFTRSIPMMDIQEVYSGRELQSLETSTPLDENCCTLVLENGNCVSFRFRDEARRERFSTCMKVLRLALE